MNFHELEKAFQSVHQKLAQHGSTDLHQLTAEGYNNLQSHNEWIQSKITSSTKQFDETIQKRIQDEYLNSGPLTPLLEDEVITEVIMNGPRNIWYEKQGVFHPWSDFFLSDLTYRNFILRLCSESDLQTNLNIPCGNGRWKDFRIHLVTPPLTPQFSRMTLRRHPKNPWTFSKLLNEEWAEPSDLEKIKKLVLTHKNILFVGPTGSGKTSILNACLQEIPFNERVISIEDTSEIQCPNPVSTQLFTRYDHNQQLKNYSEMELLKEALRMRPHRLVMGEIRGQEAKDLVLSLATGHKGAMATLHADDPWQALWRLEMLVQLGAPQWSLQAIRRLILLSLDHLICVTQYKNHRQFKGLYKITSLEETGFLLEKV